MSVCTWVCVCISHLIYSQHWGCISILAIMSSASMNMGVQISCPNTNFISFKYTPRSRIAWSQAGLFLILFQYPVCRLVWWLISGKKNFPASAGDLGLIPGSGRSPGEGKWQPTSVFLPGKSHGQRSLAGYSPCGCKESDTSEWLTLMHF